MINIDKERTINEIEGINKDVNYNSKLVTTCQNLRNKKLKEFTVEDLRIMINQNLNLNILIPISLDILIENPLISADYYYGDLLKSLLNVDKNFWIENDSLREILENLLIDIKSSYEIIFPLIEKFIINDTVT